jgi:hypothetical protein
MKKIVLTITAITALASSSFAQGLIFFSGGSAASTRISTNSVVGGPSGGAASTTAPVAGTYYYALFVSTANTASGSTSTAIDGNNSNYVFDNSSGWTLVGIAQNTAQAGRFGAVSQGSTSGSQAGINGDGSLSVPSIAGGTSVHTVVVGWSANVATTLSGLIAWYDGGANTQGYIGQSAIGSGLALGDGALVSTSNAMGTQAGQVGGFLLGLTNPTIIPEPGTMALAGLGGLSLLAFRRKK